ncbi:MAG: transposase zinc-binding domain-containing protein [Gammaproteobacteria bacterium]
MFQRFGPEYLARFGEHIPAQHHKVIEAICQCRTEAYGSVCYQCEDCGLPHVLPAACGNRHCPQCQHRKTQQWLEHRGDDGVKRDKQLLIDFLCAS